MQSQYNNAFISNNLKHRMQNVELKPIEHHMLRIITNRSHVDNDYCTQLSLEQLQALAKFKYSLRDIEAALNLLHARDIITAWTDGSLGPNLFFHEWGMHTGHGQQLSVTADGQSHQQSPESLCQSTPKSTTH